MKRRWRIVIGCSVIAGAMPVLLPAARSATPEEGTLRWIGTGWQVYTCKAEKGRFGWVLNGPDAVLTDAEGQVRGTHAAGPSWTASDGSQVLGSVMVSVPSPAAGAIPWLVLRASRHAGSGIMEGVGYVLRTETAGGSVPSPECDGSEEGHEQRSPYRAIYTFLPERGGPIQ